MAANDKEDEEEEEVWKPGGLTKMETNVELKQEIMSKCNNIFMTSKVYILIKKFSRIMK